MTVYIIMIFAVMLLIDLPRLLKKRQPGVLIVYGCVYAAAFTLCILMAMGITVSSPLIMISDFFIQVLHISY